MSILITAVCITALVVAVLVGFWGLVRLIMSLFHLAEYVETLQNSPHERQVAAENVMPLSLLLPQCDADSNIAQTVQELLALDYPEYEVVAVCNSAYNRALPLLQEAFGLVKISQPIKRSVPMADVENVFRSPAYPQLVVIDKRVKGRSDALNTGVNVSRYPLLVTLSAGRKLAGEGLNRIAQPFMLSYKVAAVGGLPRISESKSGALAALQRAEYLTCFPAGLAVPGQNSLPMVPDAFGAFRKKNVIDEGGFAPGADETEMVLRLYKKRKGGKASYEIHLLAEPVFEAEPSRRLGGLFNQRRRWQREIMSSLWRNRGMFLSARYGRAGLWDIPSHWLFDVVAPVVQLIGYILIPLAFAFSWVSTNMLLGFLAAELLLGTVVSLAAAMSQQIMESDRPHLGHLLRMVFAAIIGNIGYRQLILVFRVVATVMPAPKK